MKDKIQEVLKGMSGDGVLTEDSLNEIATVFEEAVESKATEMVGERVEIEIQTALTQLDEDHSAKLEKLLEAVDADHTAKLKAVLGKIDENHTDKLKNVVNKYEKLLKENAVQFRDQLVEEISNYMELYIDKMVPAQQIAEAVENTAAKRQLDQVKKIVSVNEEYINDNIREALQDGKSMIEESRKDLNEALKENVRLSQDLKNVKSQLILEKKTSEYPDSKRKYINKILCEKSPEYIEENFNYVVEMYERDEQDDVEILAEQAKSHMQSTTITLPESDKPEVAPPVEQKAPAGGYLEELQKQDKR
jgi:hypothetical protein